MQNERKNSTFLAALAAGENPSPTKRGTVIADVEHVLGL